MARVLHRLGLFAARRKWVVLGVWIVGIAALIALAHGFGSNTSNDLSLPGTDSQAATDLLAANFPPQQNGSSPLVFHTTAGKLTDGAEKASDPGRREAVEGPARVLGDRPVRPAAQSGLVSKDRTYAFIPVVLDIDAGQLDDADRSGGARGCDGTRARHRHGGRDRRPDRRRAVAARRPRAASWSASSPRWSS